MLLFGLLLGGGWGFGACCCCFCGVFFSPTLNACKQPCILFRVSGVVRYENVRRKQKSWKRPRKAHFFLLTQHHGKNPQKKKHHFKFCRYLVTFVLFCFVLFCLVQTKEWYDWVLMLLLSIFG
jgi:hypothetical protein